MDNESTDNLSVVLLLFKNFKIKTDQNLPDFIKKTTPNLFIKLAAP